MDGKNSMEAKDTIIEDNEEYPVKYTHDKTFTYATVYIKGQKIKGYGTDAELAYWSLDQKIYQTFHFKL